MADRFVLLPDTVVGCEERHVSIRVTAGVPGRVQTPLTAADEVPLRQWGHPANI